MVVSAGNTPRQGRFEYELGSDMVYPNKHVHQRQEPCFCRRYNPLPAASADKVPAQPSRNAGTLARDFERIKQFPTDPLAKTSKFFAPENASNYLPASCQPPPCCRLRNSGRISERASGASTSQGSKKCTVCIRCLISGNCPENSGFSGHRQCHSACDVIA